MTASAPIVDDLAEPTVTTYKPLLIILAFILGVTVLIEVRMGKRSIRCGP